QRTVTVCFPGSEAVTLPILQVGAVSTRSLTLSVSVTGNNRPATAPIVGVIEAIAGGVVSRTTIGKDWRSTLPASSVAVQTTTCGRAGTGSPTPRACAGSRLDRFALPYRPDDRSPRSRPPCPADRPPLAGHGARDERVLHLRRVARRRHRGWPDDAADGERQRAAG